jgi:hypothetical protein
MQRELFNIFATPMLSHDAMATNTIDPRGEIPSGDHNSTRQDDEWIDQYRRYNAGRDTDLDQFASNLAAYIFS